MKKWIKKFKAYFLLPKIKGKTNVFLLAAYYAIAAITAGSIFFVIGVGMGLGNTDFYAQFATEMLAALLGSTIGASVLLTITKKIESINLIIRAILLALIVLTTSFAALLIFNHVRYLDLKNSICNKNPEVIEIQQSDDSTYKIKIYTKEPNLIMKSERIECSMETESMTFELLYKNKPLLKCNGAYRINNIKNLVDNIKDKVDFKEFENGLLIKQNLYNTTMDEYSCELKKYNWYFINQSEKYELSKVYNYDEIKTINTNQESNDVTITYEENAIRNCELIEGCEDKTLKLIYEENNGTYKYNGINFDIIEYIERHGCSDLNQYTDDKYINYCNSLNKINHSVIEN